jgi:hypothetical protein
MIKYEYDITSHPAGEFNRLTYFCTEAGECGLEEVPDQQTNILRDILNKQGSEGWELVQVFFGKDGVVAFWKRIIGL